MKVHYDHMFNGLVVDLDQEAFQEMVENLQSHVEDTGEGGRPVTQVLYQNAAMEKQSVKDRTPLVVALSGVLSALSFVLLGLGGYKLYEIVRDWYF